MEINKNPLPGQALRKVDIWSNMYECYREELQERDIHLAHIVTSEVRTVRETQFESLFGNRNQAYYEGTHKPVLDIDMPVKIFPSTTEGHFHLYIDKELSWDDYCKLMNVMAEVGILEQGFVNASKQRQYSAVRLPWVKKDTKTWPKNWVDGGHDVMENEPF